ncbi:histidine--tRNA ligase [Larkinella rosea]|uniref:Histidine--tRNA ligase n=1 Tax=Larkinella rosea TaxID=2025312 RepID=A0A3P1C3B2_9BACT|nr:histidine--tRNA ligase [Larkinella rosea]RRB07314.1 histidine--tRNA ligase [Larkinella rosea]
MQKPSVPRGTRDFGPEQMSKRLFLLETIRQTFRRYGFQPIETPALENLSVLMGKYGEEGDQLLFKILNSGDFSNGLTETDWQDNAKKLTLKISEKGLRYDLTVPFARYVVMNRHALAMPFKRYQIQPVWRADRPQKGRYREFVQCDADVVGTDSLLCEAEIVLMLHESLRNLGIQDFTVKINNRKILTGIAEVVDAEGKEGPLAIAIDKLDKIGKEKVIEELKQRGFSDESIDKLEPMFQFPKETRAAFDQLKSWLSGSETGLKGVAELEEVWQLVAQYGLSDARMELDVTLARGLSYYTGAIFEVKANGVQIGSISGGGRYDNLTGAFGMPGLSGVGISLGVDRIYDVMEELNLFPETGLQSTQLLVVHLDPEARSMGLPLLSRLRARNVSAEAYPDAAKVKKQLDYANAKRIPYVVLIGSEELQTGQLTFRNMVTGEQEKLTADEIVEKLISF